eukprot:RCo020285
MSAGGSASALWSKVKTQSALALALGALQPFSVAFKVVREGGIPFVVVTASALAAKPLWHPEGVAQQPSNPLLRHEPALFVDNLSPTHKLLLNKFCVQPYHVLVCTRESHSQTEPLNEADLCATWRCVVELNGLGFYNFGIHSGRSQPHKHTQVIPLPFLPGQSATPLDDAIASVAASSAPDSLLRLPFFHFQHAICALPASLCHESHELAGQALHRAYGRLLEGIGAGLSPADAEGRLSYNVLLAKAWMMVVRRSAEAARGGALALNAVAFAGSVLVKNPQQLAMVEESGVLRLLHEVTVTV